MPSGPEIPRYSAGFRFLANLDLRMECTFGNIFSLGFGLAPIGENLKICFFAGLNAEMALLRGMTS